MLGLALGLLALGPALGPGFALRYDMVFVPDPPLRFGGGGFPRAVPSDQVVALLSAVFPAEVVQKLLLLGIFALAASGAAALVPGDRTAARLAAAAFYAWNSYLAQRLLLGQWALLLGYAGLPWAVRAASRGGVRRLVVALLPAAAGGFQAMLVTALAVLPVATLRLSSARGPSRARAVLASGAVIVVLSLPWLLPALRSHAVTDPAGVAAFAPRADGPFGTLGSLLTLGGIWNAEAGVPGQGSWGLASVRLALAAVAVAGFVRLARHGWSARDGAACDGPERHLQGQAWEGGSASYARGLGVAAVAGLLIACAGAFAPGLLKGMIGWWSGFGPFRDGQLYVAPLALAEAVGFAAVSLAVRTGTAVDRTGGAVSRTGAGAGAGARRVGVLAAGAGIAAAAVPVLVLPTFALGAFGRLGAADYPDEWRRVQAIVNEDPARGALVSLPWGAYRAFRWNGGRLVLDPATKLFARPVLWDDTLVVGVRGGGQIRVAAEDPQARRIGALVARRGAPLTAALAREGVRYVLVAGSNENEFLFRLPGATPAWRGRELVLVRL